MRMKSRGGGRGAAGGEDEDGVGLAGGLEAAAEDGEVGEVVALHGTIIARMQGTHIQAGPVTGNSWRISSSIVFESGRFAESTLQVMGTLNDIINKWSIVGGTGEFTRATGIIEFKKDLASNKEDTIRELSIHILHYPDVASAAQ
ncbi:hypothetical protein ZWY2020_000064 [Hordeum vulgare]|nr:hypothetical protein ZWY2020_000064 [Hordeum vulgare]